MSKFKQISLPQIQDISMLLLGEEFRIRQLWEEKLSQHKLQSLVHTELNHIQSIIQSLPGSQMISVLPALAKQLYPHQDLLWKPISDCNTRLNIGFLFKNRAEQQALIKILKPLFQS